MIISSNEFDSVYPQNSNTNFIIDLPATLELENEWEVALIEIWYKSTESKEQVNICADFCIQSLVDGKFIPFFRRLSVKKGYNHTIFNNPIYFQVTRSQLKNLSFYLTSTSGESISFFRNTLSMQLHFRKLHRSIWI